MLKYISEESLLQRSTEIELHYIMKSRDEALFLDEIQALMDRRFRCHLWFTRQEVSQESSINGGFSIHRKVASSDVDIGRRWEWWDLFLDITLQRLHSLEASDRSLIYLCGPQGLTDRLLGTYKGEAGMREDNVQIEKWW
jgi:ferredoxin-NADP reductase